MPRMAPLFGVLASVCFVAMAVLEAIDGNWWVAVLWGVAFVAFAISTTRMWFAKGRAASLPPPLHGKPPPPEKLEEIRRVLVRGDKIEAIKLYRAYSGAGLREARDAVEELEGPSGPSA